MKRKALSLLLIICAVTAALTLTALADNAKEALGEPQLQEDAPTYLTLTPEAISLKDGSGA